MDWPTRVASGDWNDILGREAKSDKVAINDNSRRPTIEDPESVAKPARGTSVSLEPQQKFYARPKPQNIAGTPKRKGL
jgi:hypothetical protein